MIKKITSLSSLKLFTLFTCVSLFFGCSDDENGSTNFLRFKANGSQIEFTTPGTITAAFASAGNQHNMVISALSGTGGASSTLQVYDDKVVASGTFSGYELGATAFIGALMTYSVDGTTYTQGVPSEATIVITEVTSTVVKGTFTATLKASGKSPVEITEGKFSIPRAN